ncbi:Wzz/FepE/Etk N-terminal domain-containing protein [Methylobacterium crusticola]|nr:Wzz/FepE/Etk N-terminal domain-containing protein [Methylobacterium crusticola]
MEAERPAASVTLRTLWGILRRSGASIAASVALCVAAAALFVTFSVPTYVASTQLLIEPQRQQQLLMFEPGMLDLTLDNAQVESQVELLRSERITTAVVNALKLTRNPEFQKEEGLLAWIRGPATDEVLERTESESLRVATGLLSNRVGVRRVGQSYVIEITARAYRPELAAEIANAYTAAYLRDQFDAKAQVARSGVDWLQARISDLRGHLSETARAVEDFKTQNDLATGNGGLLIEQQLSEMNSQLVSARAQTSQTAARLARVRAVTEAGAGSAAVAEIINNQVMTNLRQRQQEAAQREADLRERYGPRHEAVAAAHREVEQAERDIGAEMRRIAQVYLSDHDIAVARERGIETEIRRLIGEADRRRMARVTLSELEAQAQSYRRMYQNLLEKLSETIQKETLPITSARVIAPAATPLDKNTPRTKLTLALGGAVGLLLGIAICTARTRFDQTVRSAADIQRAYAGVDCLGLVPALRPALPGPLGLGLPGPRKGLLGPLKGPPGPGLPGPHKAPLGLEVVEAPFSPFTRAMRGVKVAIDVAREGRTITTIGVASISPGEGKSSIALNLAALSAQAGCRTLLIDADFLEAALSRALVPGATAGLLEMLAERGDAIQPTAVPRLDVLPAVFAAPVAQSSEILRSPQMQALLTSLASAYELVVIDISAMRSAMDVRALGRILDGVLLVAAWGETEVSSLADAAGSLEAAQAQVLGIVLNKVRDTEAVSRAI